MSSDPDAWRDVPVTIRAEDAWAGANACDWWADRCAPGADRHLRATAERLRAAARAAEIPEQNTTSEGQHR